MLAALVSLVIVALFVMVGTCRHDSERRVGSFTESHDGVDVVIRYFECEHCGNVRKERTKATRTDDHP